VTGRVPDRQWKQDFYIANKDAWCKQAASGGTDFTTQIARENCVDGNVMRAGDSVNYAIGQGDTLVTPIQMARIYAALSNGGTLYRPTVAKAVVTPSGQLVRDIPVHEDGKLPDDQKTLDYINEATAGVITEGTAAWKFVGAGWPQDKIQLHAKTGTAEVYGKQTTSWLATYSKDYAVVMTISQAGTGSGGSGDAVRRIYQALYGVDDKGGIDNTKALLPTPQAELPKFNPDGTAQVSTSLASVPPLVTAQPSTAGASPTQAGPTQASPAQVSPTSASSGTASPAQASPAQASPALASPAQASPALAGPGPASPPRTQQAGLFQPDPLPAQPAVAGGPPALEPAQRTPGRSRA
jgi:penicillin-binding protein 2